MLPLQILEDDPLQICNSLTKGGGQQFEQLVRLHPPMAPIAISKLIESVSQSAPLKGIILVPNLVRGEERSGLPPSFTQLDQQ